MRFVVDQPVSPRVAEKLAAAGYDAIHVRDRGMSAAEDIEILAVARSEQRIVVSQDQDFATLLAASGASTPSVIRLRLRDGRAEAHAGAIIAALPKVGDALERGAIVVLTEGGARVRNLPIR